ncbi:MAG TPA: response regulator [Stellaceae bacterium]|nr:response regulator [Stellaceae bacterium]
MPDPSPDRPDSDAPVRSFMPSRPRWPDWLTQSPRLVALALVLAGALPPVGLAALPGGLAMLGAPHTGIVLVSALLFAPALVGFTVALQGLDTALARLRGEAGGEYRQIIARVLLAALILGYVFALLAALPDDPSIGPSLLIGSLNLAAAWLFLLNVILDPRRSGLRRWAALVSDVTLLSILLAAGGGLTAPLALVYCYIAISNAEHHGRRALLAALGLELAAFAVVTAATPYWREHPLLAAGLALAMVLLPAYVGAVLHRLGAARSEAESANAAKNRFLAALSDDLRAPLRTIARAGAALDRAALDPAQWDTISRVRLSARAMLLQLDDMLNYVKIDGGTFAPETRSFDLYRLANGAVAALRAPAAERGIVLALRIDPLLPYQLRGWPHQLRQIIICLITNAIRHSGKAKVRINLDAIDLDDAELGAAQVTLRLAVASTLAENPLETVDEDMDATGRPLGLAVADRLVGLMGGRLAVETDARRGLAMRVELPFAIDQASLSLPLDLAHLPLLIVTKDAEFVADLIEPLEAWRGDPRWIGAGDAALDYLASFDSGMRRAALIVDGRGDVLQALAWAHRATEPRGPEPPYVLFVADEPRIDSVIGLADGELDGILPAPFTHAALRGALHALRVEPADWFLADGALPALDEPAPARRGPPATEEIAPLRPRAAGPPRPAPVEEAAAAAASPPDDMPIRFVPPRSAPAAGSSGPRRRQILVAAGNPANRKILGSILAGAGHIVHFAEDVDEARQGLETRDIDALLLDLTGYAGADFGAARHCRRARPNLPIIALSGEAPEIAERRARAAGLDAVLPKPVEGRRLVAAIATALDDEPRSAAAGPRAVVTEIASHPRFAGESAAASGSDGGQPLWSASQEGEALQDLIDNFRVESARIVADIDRACGTGDVESFAAAVQAMHGCTEVFGVTRVRETLATIRAPTPAKLRLQGADFVHRLEGDIARLDAALIDYLKSAK